ncbi:MAG: hypothetical protein KIT80_09900 [Chitinophagaceae bacterium]|nr:hypothetical protein [Chitinophagaceae bacterium]MCW5927213.1 hypothetical protein [Chitinophagaceae bacterium]
MSKLAAIKLIKSLSGSEKRYFKSYAKRQSVNRIYLDLFMVIEEGTATDEVVIEKKFYEKHKNASIHNATNYLVKILTDCLIQLKMSKDIEFQLLQGMMRVRVLQERSLYQEAYRELQTIRSAALAFQHPVVPYLTYREELNYLSEVNFPSVTDREIVGMQMKAKGLLRDLSNIHDHHSLFELLKYRLIHARKISSKEELEKLNDLVLSEMGLATSKPSKSFAAQKLHLLFQSFYFTNIGEYKSALKTFASLNKLFETHIDLQENPPLDYLSALDGILDNLHMLEYYDQMPFYVTRVEQLDQPGYPEYFRNRVQKTSIVYQSIQLMQEKKYEAVSELIQSMGKDWQMYQMVDEEKQWELYFYMAISFYWQNNLNKAHKWINQVLQLHIAHKHWLICKAVRLLNIVIYYELGDNDYLEYEIKAYKRFFEKEHLLKSELLLFQYIRLKPEVKYLRRQPLQELVKEMDSLLDDRFERQLLKYFDCLQWISERLRREKLGRKPR